VIQLLYEINSIEKKLKKRELDEWEREKVHRKMQEVIEKNAQSAQ
jgi:hypothetical protein